MFRDRFGIDSNRKRFDELIDEIDRVLAEYYGFTDEELDFILHYDIKYRIGQDAAEEEDA